MRITAQLYTFMVLGNREETSASVCDQGSHDTAVNVWVTDFCQAVRAISWQLIALLCGSTWKPVPHQIVRCGISCAPALFNSP